MFFFIPNFFSVFFFSFDASFIDNVIVESAILPETERVNKIRASTITPSQLVVNPSSKKSSSSISVSNVFYANGKAHSQSKQQQQHHHHQQQQYRIAYNGQQHNHQLNELYKQQKQPIQKHSHEIDRKNMEFLIPRPPNTAATCQSQATLSNIVAPRFTLNDIKSHLSDNFKIIQSAAAPPQKMTKKQLKLAQAQLDKLTQINIHLQGMLN